jgi:hypothetical protein
VESSFFSLSRYTSLWITSACAVNPMPAENSSRRGSRSVWPVSTFARSFPHGDRLRPWHCQTSIERKDGRRDQDDRMEREAHLSEHIPTGIRVLLKSVPVPPTIRTRPRSYCVADFSPRRRMRSCSFLRSVAGALGLKATRYQSGCERSRLNRESVDASLFGCRAIFSRIAEYG